MQSLCLGTGRTRRFDHPVSGGYFWYLVFGSPKLRHSPDLAEVAGCVSAKSRENCNLDRQRNPKVARWSAQDRGMPRSSRFVPELFVHDRFVRARVGEALVHDLAPI